MAAKPSTVLLSIHIFMFTGIYSSYFGYFAFASVIEKTSLMQVFEIVVEISFKKRQI